MDTGRRPTENSPTRLRIARPNSTKTTLGRYMALGYLALTDRQTDEAVRHFQTALDLNPNFAAAYGYIGLALVFDGRSDEAFAISSRRCG